MFGQVVEGYNIVKAVEACGSRSGDTSADVIIGDCGVVASAGTTRPTAEEKLSWGRDPPPEIPPWRRPRPALGSPPCVDVPWYPPRRRPRAARAVPRVGRALSVMSAAAVIA